MSRGAKKTPPGVFARHSPRCATRRGGRCSCVPGYQASAWSRRDRKPIRRTFATIADAQAWRRKMQVALDAGTARAPSNVTLAEAAEAWLEATKAGIIRTRSGHPYKPSALRSYEQALRTKALPRLGARRLSSVSRNAVQDLVDELVGDGLAPSSVRNAVLPLRAIFRRAHQRDEVAVNPTLKLALPTGRAGRERVARPEEAALLLAAVPDADRAIWATALYAGLRL